jgi:hypothetical protein
MLNVQRTTYCSRVESWKVGVPSKPGNYLLSLLGHFVFNARLTNVKDNNIIYNI